MCFIHIDTVQSVDKVCLLNEVEYIRKKYTSAYFYAITDGKEKFIFYEYGRIGIWRTLSAWYDPIKINLYSLRLSLFWGLRRGKARKKPRAGERGRGLGEGKYSKSHAVKECGVARKRRSAEKATHPKTERGVGVRKGRKSHAMKECGGV